VTALSEWKDARRRMPTSKTYKPEGNLKADLDMGAFFAVIVVAFGILLIAVAKFLLNAHPFGHLYGFGWLLATVVLICQAAIHSKDAYVSQERAERSATRIYWSAIVCLSADVLIIPAGVIINHVWRR
jgi:hypothetical protein